jgi:exosortase/archaeosortase family protein
MLSLDFIAERFEGINARQSQVLVFLIKLNIFAIPLYAILLLDLNFVPFQKLIADIMVSLLAVAGYNPTISDLLISIPISNGTWAAVISWDCTAWKSMLAFFALVMATNRTTKAKTLGLAIFLPLVFLVNIVRIFFMFLYVHTFDLAYYELVHAAVWSWGMIFAVLAFWTVWMKKMKSLPVREGKRTTKNKYILRSK